MWSHETRSVKAQIERRYFKNILIQKEQRSRFVALKFLRYEQSTIE